ncbi:unnamed protein product [Adineta ricciae]|uniref:G-protein coupled receptors family 1 profile domain-containing protein n=1 Tax=Adineta ricciae TaxID=249248 RepID=A0A814R453_ADIRI|nr:unnamed protein product [Adineta ricciae]CAF1478991.1 unnamed protein product [Adineta ricciae]
MSSEKYSYQCNRGIAVLQKNEIRCLCPPAYYGDFCQFFSDRISIIASVDQKTELTTILNRTLKIRANLLFNKQIVDHHEFHIVSKLEKSQTIKHKFYLLYSSTIEMLSYKRKRYFNRTDIIINHPYEIYFHVFILEKNNMAEEIGSWYYPIYFDYLPAFRLAVVLKFPSSIQNTTVVPYCQQTCKTNSNCLPIFNQNNSYYCSCKNGYFGSNCLMYESLCKTFCSVNALCRVDESDFRAKKKKSYCICPLGHFGARCHLRYNDCYSNICLNNGTCITYYDPSGENLLQCKCSEGFFGRQCEHVKPSVHIHLNMTESMSTRAVVIQCYDYPFPSPVLETKDQQVYKTLPSSVRLCQSKQSISALGILKIYQDLSEAQYFLIYCLTSQLKINITSSPQYCSHASSLLPKELDQSIENVYKYHQICRHDIKPVCFYDEDYFCICQQDHYRAECFIRDIERDSCEKCLSGGKCLQGDLRNPNDFICLCPNCHQGHQCEFSMEAFGVTVESFLIDYSKQVKITYTSIVVFLFLIGLFNNFCSFITFKRSTPRKFTVGNYLLIITFLNQIALFCLFFKFIDITVGNINLRSCQIISYFLSVTTRSTYWLTTWIAIDRFLMLIFPTSSYFKNSRISIIFSVITLIILFVMHIHEIIYKTILTHFSTNSFVCVTNFETNLISTYNRISTLIHYLVPFSIQTICITILIVFAARSRAKVVGRQTTFTELLKKQFETQKELYVTPMIIVLSALPQTILTFYFACTQLNTWQQHLLLNSYLLSYVPQVLGFILYVLPSTNYKKEFFHTLIGKNSKWIFSKKN